MSEDPPAAIEWPAGISPEDNWELVASHEELIPYDLTAEPTALVFLSPGWTERFKELTPRAPMCRCTVLPVEPEEDHG